MQKAAQKHSNCDSSYSIQHLPLICVAIQSDVTDIHYAYPADPFLQYVFSMLSFMSVSFFRFVFVAMATFFASASLTLIENSFWLWVVGLNP